MTEKELIHRYFYRPISSPFINTSIGDDAAIVTVPDDMQLVMTMDTLNEDIHFLKETDAYSVGYKAAAVNLSDLASMGASPKWVTLSLSIPTLNEQWLAEFSRGFFALLDKYNTVLIGGDINRGSLSITVQAEGFVPKNQALLRSTAQPNDLIYVSNTLGGAAFALDQLKQHKPVNKIFQEALEQPNPQIELGLALRNIATSCIDLSDGLARDLINITDASHVGALIDVSQLPIFDYKNTGIDYAEAVNYALCGGDDYQLCFTIPPTAEADLNKLKHLSLTKIGVIITTKNIEWTNLPFDSKNLKGFEHFTSKVEAGYLK